MSLPSSWRGRRADLLSFGSLAGLFAVMTAVTWKQWFNPVIDSGREMDQPWRVLQGQHLYSQVYQLYQPLGPYIGALLYRVFGISLNTLYGEGGVCALIVLGCVYWVARRRARPLGAWAAGASYIALCVFKPSGVYFFPYSFAGVDAVACSALAMVLLLRFVERARWAGEPAGATQPSGFGWLLTAGVLTGIALACKVEIGAAPAVCGFVLLLRWGGARDARRLRWRRIALFVLPGAAIPLGAYAWVLRFATWKQVVTDSYVLLYNLPAGLKYYNSWKAGTNRPLHSVLQLLLENASWFLICGLIALGARTRAAGRFPTWRELPTLLRRLLIWSALICLLAVPLRLKYHGPLGASPLLALGVIILLTSRWRRVLREQGRTSDNAVPAQSAAAETGQSESDVAGWSRSDWVLLLLALHTVVISLRVFLRLPSGGVAGSFLLPLTIVFFTWITVEFPAWLAGLPGIPAEVSDGASASPVEKVQKATSAAATAACWATGLVCVLGLVVTVVISFRYHAQPEMAVATNRGTFYTPPELATSFQQALQFIQTHTRPGDSILSLPEGSDLNFLAARPTPERYEIFTPGFLDQAAEKDAIQRLASSNTQFIFVMDRPTGEFGAKALGVDYYQTLMSWIYSHYRLERVLGRGANPNSPIGSPHFWIKIYARRSPVKRHSS